MSPGSPRPTRTSRRVALGAILGSVALLALLVGLAVLPAAEARQTTRLEQEYVRLAMDLRSTSLCEKIATDSYEVRANGILARSRIYYVQSECYWEVASFAANSRLCEKVRPFPVPPLRALALDGNVYTPQSCMDHLNHPNRSAVTHVEFPVAFLELLGYVRFDGDEPIPLDRRLSRTEFAYLRLLKSGENVDKASRLPDFNAGDDAARVRLATLLDGCRDDWSTTERCRRYACLLTRDHTEFRECYRSVSTWSRDAEDFMDSHW